MYRLILASLIIFFAACSGQKTDKVTLADLILNQKECFFGQMKGEIISGQFIINDSIIVAKLEKLDDSRLSAKISGTAVPTIFVVASNGNHILAGILNSEPLISCKIN